MSLLDGIDNRSLLNYSLTNRNTFNIHYGNDLIFSFTDADYYTIQFKDTNDYIYCSQLLNDLSAINGTDNDEIINGTAGETNTINPHKGTDIINLVADRNTINYTVGDGYKTINSENVRVGVNITGIPDELPSIEILGI